MKEMTVHSLVIARALLERAEPLCHAEDRYLASAGLVVLQDALEIVFLALLMEIGVGDSKNMERKTFDELLSELKSADIIVPKSLTLKALNKQRVLTKHYAQVAEPTSVRNYFVVATQAIEMVMRQVMGCSIQDLFIADLLRDGEAKTYLKEAEKAITEGRFFDALFETRKAIFVGFEEDFSIYGWRDYERKASAGFGILEEFRRGGWNVPYWKRNKTWIDENVKVPTDYIQIDYENLRLQAMEYGIHTVELHNIRRLTPDVFRAGKEAKWSYACAVDFHKNNATETNAKYCLDRAVSMILKKQEHAGAWKGPARGEPFDPPPIYDGQVVYEKPSTDTAQVHVVAKGYEYKLNRIVGGFNPEESFYEILFVSRESAPDSTSQLAVPHYKGYLQILPETD